MLFDPLTLHLIHYIDCLGLHTSKLEHRPLSYSVLLKLPSLEIWEHNLEYPVKIRHGTFYIFFTDSPHLSRLSCRMSCGIDVVLISRCNFSFSAWLWSSSVWGYFISYLWLPGLATRALVLPQLHEAYWCSVHHLWPYPKQPWVPHWGTLTTPHKTWLPDWDWQYYISDNKIWATVWSLHLSSYCQIYLTKYI